MKPTEIRWGVVGCGQIAVDKSIPALLAARGARLVAIADPLEPRRALALGLARAAGLPAVRAGRDATEVFADPDVDAVYLALPTGDHAAAVAAAAHAGKAILCEKPLGRSAPEVRAMVRAARARGVRLMTAYMSRFGDGYQAAVRLLREGAIGRVTYVAAHFAYPCFTCYPPGAPGGWRYTDPAGGGPLLDIGVYLAFGLREMLGERIAEVLPLSTSTHPPAGSAVADTTVACFVTDRGTPGTFVTSFSHTGLRLEFCGTQGTLTVTECFLQTPGARVVCTGAGEPLVLDSRTHPPRPHFEHYRREFEHFSAALRDGTPHAPSDADVMADALLLDALKESGRRVTIPTAEQFLTR